MALLWFHHRKCVRVCGLVLTVVTNPSGRDERSSRSRRPGLSRGLRAGPGQTEAALLAGLPPTGPPGCAFISFPGATSGSLGLGGIRGDCLPSELPVPESITSAWLQQPAPGLPTSTSCTRSWGSEFVTLCVSEVTAACSCCPRSRSHLRLPDPTLKVQSALWALHCTCSLTVG